MALESKLERSVELEQALHGLTEAVYPATSSRIEVGRVLCELSLEHWHSFCVLLEVGAFSSAMTMMRAQYEAFVRAVWVTYAASEPWIERLSAELTLETAKQANDLPLLAAMVSEMEGKAPAPAMEVIREIKDNGWKHMSSFAHGGLFAIHRGSHGYPIPFLDQTLRNANGIAVSTGMMVVILSGNTNLQGVIPSLQREFADCLPPPKLA